jgi:hypothetical protein
MSRPVTKTGDISAAQNPYETGMVGTLRRVVAVLNEARVPYWIDCGTLLGLIRDQKLIPWDEDVELGAWLTDKPLFDARTPDFLTQGLVVTVDKPDKLGLQLPDGLPYKFRILFYDRREHCAARGGLVGVTRLGHVLDFTRRTLADAEKSSSSTPTSGALRKLAAQLARVLPGVGRRTLLSLLERAPVRMRHRWEIPAHYFEQTRTVVFYDFDALIPADADGYLTHRYGPDWGQPTRYWVDHTCIDTSTRHK